MFGPGADGGRDGAFQGVWAGKDHSGSFTVQCKHFTGERRNLRPSDLTDEIEKAAVLAAAGLADVYVIMTNASIPAPREAKIRAMFRARGVQEVLTFGAEWIEAKIVESPRLRALVPRLYGLGDLTQILDARAYEQAQRILSTMSDELRRFVPTGAYRAAVDAFGTNRFVMLVGEPAAGKTTIAYTLALYAADKSGASLIEATGRNQVIAHWNPNEPQVFILDDLFGTTQYQRTRSDDWNRNTPRLRVSLPRFPGQVVLEIMPHRRRPDDSFRTPRG